MFASDGTFVRAVGAAGEGPGELSSPGSLSLEPGGAISVFDFGKAALVRFAADGSPMAQQPLPFVPWPGPSRHFQVTSEGILVATMLPSAPEGKFHHVLRLMGSRDTALVAERLFDRPGMVRYPACGGGLNLPAIFEMQVTWATNSRRTVAVDGPEYAFTLFDGARPVRVVRTGRAPRPASEALALADLGDGFSIDFGRGPCTIPPRDMVDGRGFAEHVPWIDQIMLSPNDEVWIHRRGVGDEIPDAVDFFSSTVVHPGR